MTEVLEDGAALSVQIHFSLPCSANQSSILKLDFVHC